MCSTLDVLRHGFKLPAVKVELCSFQPDHGMNPDTLKRYQCNRLRVVPEVSYSPHAREAGSGGQSYNPRLDLVLFVNGIPTATLELKSEFKQSVENAKRQYRNDRPVKDPLTRKPEPLLTFKRGALVHFAVGQNEVATLSRLNRTFGDSKQTFILDFFNEPQDILDAFLPYYTKAELTDVTDPQIIYDLQKTLDAEGIYHWQEVEAFALAFFDPKAQASKLSYYCAPAKERFAKRYTFSLESRQQALDYKRTAEANGDSAGLKKAEHALKEAGEQVDQLDLFRKNLQSFVRLYEFLSQIVPYEDHELEQLCVYAKHLHPLLRVDRLLEDDVDVGELQLSHYRLSKRAEHVLRLNEETGIYTVKPGSDVGSGKPHDPEKKRLSEIIEALNDIFGAEVSDDDQLQFLTGIAQRISRQEDVMAQVNNHSVGRLQSSRDTRPPAISASIVQGQGCRRHLLCIFCTSCFSAFEMSSSVDHLMRSRITA